MDRAEKVRDKAREIVDNGRKPSAAKISEELGYSAPDVHRCLNFLERRNEVETYTKTVFGREHRMIGVNRR